VQCDLVAQRELVTIDEVMNTYGDLTAAHATYADLAASASTYAQLVQVVGTTTTSSPDPARARHGRRRPAEPLRQ